MNYICNKYVFPSYIGIFSIVFLLTFSILSLNSNAEEVDLQNCIKPPITVLDYVTVAPQADNNVLTWASIVEYDNVGFNIHRATQLDENGQLINPTQVNSELIPAQENVDLLSDGAVYHFTDQTIDPNVTYYYIIENVDTFDIPTLQTEFIVEATRDKPQPAANHIYGVHDEALNDAIFFTYNVQESSTRQLGEICKGCDIEAMAIDPTTGNIYVGSGNNAFGHPKGYLYQLSPDSGELFPIGPSLFNDLSGLAFDNTGTLWAWAKSQGLATLDVNTGQGTLVLPTDVALADISWDNSYHVLYGVIGRQLWQYTPADGQVAKVCGGLPHKTEAIITLPPSILPEGLVLLGSHKNRKLELQAYEVATCKRRKEFNLTVGYDDVEGLATLSAR